MKLELVTAELTATMIFNTRTLTCTKASTLFNELFLIAINTELLSKVVGKTESSQRLSSIREMIGLQCGNSCSVWFPLLLTFMTTATSESSIKY